MRGVKIIDHPGFLAAPAAHLAVALVHARHQFALALGVGRHIGDLPADPGLQPGEQPAHGGQPLSGEIRVAPGLDQQIAVFLQGAVLPGHRETQHRITEADPGVAIRLRRAGGYSGRRQPQNHQQGNTHHGPPARVISDRFQHRLHSGPGVPGAGHGHTGYGRTRRILQHGAARRPTKIHKP